MTVRDEILRRAANTSTSSNDRNEGELNTTESKSAWKNEKMMFVTRVVAKLKLAELSRNATMLVVDN